MLAGADVAGSGVRSSHLVRNAEGGRGGGMDVHDRRAELSSIFLFQLLEKDLHFLAICCALGDEMKALYRSKVSILSLNLIHIPKRKKSMARRGGVRYLRVLDTVRRLIDIQRVRHICNYIFAQSCKL